jgi:HAMP domain-containing protein
VVTQVTQLLILTILEVVILETLVLIQIIVVAVTQELLMETQHLLEDQTQVIADLAQQFQYLTLTTLYAT